MPATTSVRLFADIFAILDLMSPDGRLWDFAFRQDETFLRVCMLECEEKPPSGKPAKRIVQDYQLRTIPDGGKVFREEAQPGDMPGLRVGRCYLR